MRASPPTLNLVLRSSRRTLAFVILSHGASAALLLALPLPWLVRIAGALSVLALGGFEIWRRSGARAPARLAVDDDGKISVEYRDGTLRRGSIVADTYVGSALTTIVWRPIGARVARTLLVTTDGVDADDFRRLRMRLRYARVGVSASGNSDDVAG